jgi:hypothetical protein
MAENVLYVILHGLISLVDTGAGFNAYMFDMSTDHKYLYGTWLLENEIPPRNEGQDPLIFTLDSVIGASRDSATNVLHPNLNLVIQLNGRTLPLNLPDVRAVIRLPRPRMIYYYTCGQLEDNSIPEDTSGLVNGVAPRFISETRVFEYTFADSQKPQLLVGNPPSGPSLWHLPKDLAPVGDRNVATLHFYDEPGEEMGLAEAEQHARAEFALGTKRLGLPLTLTKASIRNLPEPEGGNPLGLDVLGILPEETTPLDGRFTEFLDRQYLRRSGKPRPGSGGGGGGGPICGTGNAQ